LAAVLKEVFDLIGSPGWIRTSDHSINSQALFHFIALQGISHKLRSATFY